MSTSLYRSVITCSQSGPLAHRISGRHAVLISHLCSREWWVVLFPKMRTSSVLVLGVCLLILSVFGQDVLREKEHHIEQLLKERELERSELTVASSHAEQTERKLKLLGEKYEQVSVVNKVYIT